MRLSVILCAIVSIFLGSSCASGHQSNQPDASISTVKADDESLVVTVDRSSNFEQMVVANKFDWTNLRDTAFLLTERYEVGTIELYLVQPGFLATTEEVINYLFARGFKSASPEHLLTLGIKYPNKQRSFPIFSLRPHYDPEDNMWKVLGLVGNGGERGLYLATPRAIIWPRNCRFLVERRW